MGKLVRPTVSKHALLGSDHSRIGRAVELPVQASFLQLELSKFEGSLARKLRFHIFHLHFLREVSHESLEPRLRAILLSFAAGHRKSYWSVCIKAAIVICQQVFSV